MDKKHIIPIMFCFDTHYVIPAAIAFYSLLKNAKNISVGGGGR
ncbi:lipopolysaccharide 1,2-glucosyltransferase [Helicobacter sp. 11S03491-1]|nr:lipopolysaccharide 1,2-glucosyltransferase [Helicobacter sp. 11S03491-1]